MSFKYCIIGGFILMIFSGVIGWRQDFRKIEGSDEKFSLLFGDLNSLYYQGNLNILSILSYYKYIIS